MPKVIVFEVRGVQVPKEHLEAQAFLDPFFAQLKEEVKKSRHTRIVSGYEDNLRNLGEGMLWALPAHSRTMSGSLGNPHWIPSDAEMGDDLRDLVPTAQINVFLPYLPP